MTVGPAVPEADRGRLEISPTVLRRIVEHAADQVPGTLRHGKRVAGIDVGEAGASARVTLSSPGATTVDVRLDLTLQYPASIRAVVADVRARVGSELARIAGHDMRALTVTVSGLRGGDMRPSTTTPRPQ